jgi:uncharacterized protein (DUF1697 family)
MTEEELREKIAEWLFNHSGISKNNSIRYAKEFLTLVKGLMFEVQAQKCAKCPKNKEGQPAD